MATVHLSRAAARRLVELATDAPSPSDALNLRMLLQVQRARLTVYTANGYGGVVVKACLPLEHTVDAPETAVVVGMARMHDVMEDAVDALVYDSDHVVARVHATYVAVTAGTYAAYVMCTPCTTPIDVPHPCGALAAVPLHTLSAASQNDAPLPLHIDAAGALAVGASARAPCRTVQARDLRRALRLTLRGAAPLSAVFMGAMHDANAPLALVSNVDGCTTAAIIVPL